MTRSYARRKGRGPKLEPPLALLERLAFEVDDQMLGVISRADRGDDADLHLQELTRIRETLEVPSPLEWHPAEVLELVRWSEPEHHQSQPRPFGDREHIMRAFCCSVLIVAGAQSAEDDDRIGEIDSLARLLDSLIALGPPYEQMGVDFLWWRAAHLPKELEERPFFYFALLLLTVRLPSPADLPGACALTRLVVSEEAAVRRSEWAMLPRNDGPWLLGVTCYDQSKDYWREFGGMLESAAKSNLTGQARREVVDVARRLSASEGVR